MPKSLLLVNKFFYEDVTACLRHYADPEPVVLLYRHTPGHEEGEDQVPTLIRMLHLGRAYDNRNKKASRLERAGRKRTEQLAVRRHCARGLSPTCASQTPPQPYPAHPHSIHHRQQERHRQR